MNIIIGAGISGLSYAAFSEEDYIIFESDSEIGGYCKTTKRNGFTWDFAGHFFHFKNEEIKKYVFERMKEQRIFNVNKITKIKYSNNYIDFPFQKNIHQLSKEEYIECLIGLVEKEEKDEYSSFKEMILGKFGRAICEKFLIPYNEKLYATDLNNLDQNAMGRFFPYADLKDIILNANDACNSSYNAQFIYPEGGAIEFVNAIATEVDSSKIHLNTKIVEVDIEKKYVLTDKGEKYYYDKLINTAPLPKLYDFAKLNYDKSVYSSNFVSVFNLGFDKPAKSDHHWVYFPDKNTSFYRIGYYNNILSENRLSLYVEIGHNHKNCSIIDKDSLIKQVISDLKKEGVIDDHKLIDFQYIKMDPAYVHVSEASEKDKIEKLDYLENSGIYSIGRYGAWRYCSIEDNIIEALELVKKNEK